MAPEDEKKTAFITNQELHYYKVMPFGLKNTKATYQYLINKVFKDQIGHNVEVYIDDMLVKNCKKVDMWTWKTLMLWRYQMRLNSKKCAFGVSSRKFLSFMVLHHGIVANP